VSRDRVAVGHPKPHIWNQRPQFAYTLYTFLRGYNDDKGEFTREHPIVKRFYAENFLSAVKIGPNNCGFSTITGVGVNFFVF